jgi:hypothetical protein
LGGRRTGACRRYHFNPADRLSDAAADMKKKLSPERRKAAETLSKVLPQMQKLTKTGILNISRKTNLEILALSACLFMSVLDCTKKQEEGKKIFEAMCSILLQLMNDLDRINGQKDDRH